MKLKGKNAKKLKDVPKKKMEATLKRMEETRKKDNVNLRAQINAKLEQLVIEQAKAKKYIDDYNSKIESLEEMSLKIEGAIVSLKEIVSNDTNV